MCMSRGWQPRAIEDEKTMIRNLLRQVVINSGEDKLISYLQSEIDKSKEKPQTSGESLTRLLLVLNLLSLLSKSDTKFNHTQIMRLKQDAYDIFRVEAIESGGPFSYFYYDLHQLISKNLYKAGYKLGALLSLQQGIFLEKQPSKDYSFPLGIRYLRLGDASKALQSFEKSKKQGAANSSLPIFEFKALRLSGGKPHEIDIPTEQDHPLALDSLWEKTCLETRDSGSIKNLIKLSRSKPFNEMEIYILEAGFYAKGVKQTNLIHNPLKTSTIAKKKLQQSRNTTFLKMLRALEQGYLEDIPLNIRLNSILDLAPQIANLELVEHELLAYLAYSRWFYRHDMIDLGASFLDEYKALSLRLCQRPDVDPLGIARDLF